MTLERTLEEVMGYEKEKLELRQKMEDAIIQMSEDELNLANYFFGNFRSMHEAYAVILEEFEEVEMDFDSAKEQLEIMWERVKKSDDSFKEIEISNYNLEKFKRYATSSALETIQVIAMISKAQRCLNR